MLYQQAWLAFTSIALTVRKLHFTKSNTNKEKWLKSMNKYTSVRDIAKLREWLLSTKLETLSAESNFREETVCIKYMNEW